MSYTSVNYNCPNCGKRVKESGYYSTIKCFGCGKVICHDCSPNSFCEDCFSILKYEDQELMKLVMKRKKNFTRNAYIIAAIGIVLIIISQQESLSENIANILTMISGAICFGGTPFYICCAGIKYNRKDFTIGLQLGEKMQESGEYSGDQLIYLKATYFPHGQGDGESKLPFKTKENFEDNNSEFQIEVSCKNCGVKNSLGSEFCVNCGSKLI